MQSRARTDKGRYCDYHSYRFYFDVGARWGAGRMSLLQARYSVMENEGEKALVAQGSTQVIPVLPLRDVVVYPHMVIPLFVGREKPILPLRDVVVYPHMVIPLFVGREKSIHALEAAMAGEKKILLVAQRSAAGDDPQPDDIYDYGTGSINLQLF